MTCQPCAKSFATWRSFKQHMTRIHNINERNLVRRAAQLTNCEKMTAVRTEQGSWFLYGQGRMF